LGFDGTLEMTMFNVFAPRFFFWLAVAVHVTPYILIASALYWSIWWLLIPAAPIVFIQLSTFIPIRKGPMG
jgi:hypothetical protein